jgi:hypothetical protein
VPGDRMQKPHPVIFWRMATFVGAALLGMVVMTHVCHLINRPQWATDAATEHLIAAILIVSLGIASIILWMPRRR